MTTPAPAPLSTQEVIDAESIGNVSLLAELAGGATPKLTTLILFAYIAERRKRPSTTWPEVVERDLQTNLDAGTKFFEQLRVSSDPEDDGDASTTTDASPD